MVGMDSLTIHQLRARRQAFGDYTSPAVEIDETT